MKTDDNNTGKKIAIYARTARNGGPAAIERQVSKIRADMKALGFDDADIEAAEVYSDIGFTKDGRQYKKLLAKVRAGDINVVAVSSIDRLARGVSVVNLVFALYIGGATVVADGQVLDVTDDGDPLADAVKIAVAEYEKKAVCDRIRLAHRARNERRAAEQPTA